MTQDSEHAQPQVPPQAAPQVPEEEWNRVHPLTPILQSIGIFIAIILAAIYGLRDFIQNSISRMVAGEGLDLTAANWLGSHPLVVLAIVGGIILIVLLAGLVSWLQWRVMGYRVDEEAIYARSGLISKKLRKARLDRVQSIDLQQKVLPRICGLAELVFDVAGGKDSNVSLKYISKSKAEALRDELLAKVKDKKAEGSRATQTTQTSSQTEPAGPGSPAVASAGENPDFDPTQVTPNVDLSAPERDGDSIGVRLSKRLGHLADSAAGEVEGSLNDMLAPYQVANRVNDEGEIVRVPVHRVVLSSLLKTETLIGVLVVIALVITSIVFFVIDIKEAAVPILFGALPAIFGFGAGVKKDLNNANFVVRMTESGLAVSHGLASTSRKVIPLDRVQAVALHQPLLWRWAGWWKAEYNIASAGDGTETNLLLPVGNIDQALTMIGLALPEPEVEGELSARSLILSAMYDRRSEDDHAAEAEARFFGQPRSTRFIDPLVYRRRAYTLTSTMLILRLGALDRRVDFVPHVRVQSMSYHQGPLLRSMGLASVNVHSTAGPITPRVVHQSDDQAQRFFAEHAVRTRMARQRFDAAGKAGGTHQ